MRPTAHIAADHPQPVDRNEYTIGSTELQIAASVCRLKDCPDRYTALAEVARNEVAICHPFHRLHGMPGSVLALCDRVAPLNGFCARVLWASRSRFRVCLPP
jgi:hypothetical protein